MECVKHQILDSQPALTQDFVLSGRWRFETFGGFLSTYRDVFMTRLEYELQSLEFLWEVVYRISIVSGHEIGCYYNMFLHKRGFNNMSPTRYLIEILR